MSDELAGHVRTAFQDTKTPLWLPELTPELVDRTWREMDRDLHLTPADYGTVRVLRRNRLERRQIVVSLGGARPNQRGCDPIPVELLPLEILEQLGGSELRLFEVDEILTDRVSAPVEEALGILSCVPSVLQTVCTLVRALHLIDTGDDETDVSFSAPTMPFSAFVSVPGLNAEAGSLRVAEALLHEAMHLQLTMVEGIVPLVTSSGATYFSPWRNEFRTAQGVLHALYVFRVIESFLSILSSTDQDYRELRSNAIERSAVIASQVREIADFGRCPDLTPDGAALVRRLLAL